MGRSVPLKDEFNATHSCPRTGRHGSPGEATADTAHFSQAAEAGVRGRPRPQPLSGSSWERDPQPLLGMVGKRCRVTRLGAARMNNFGELWAVGPMYQSLVD